MRFDGFIGSRSDARQLMPQWELNAQMVFPQEVPLKSSQKPRKGLLRWPCSWIPFEAISTHNESVRDPLLHVRAEIQNPGGIAFGKTECCFWSLPRIKMIEYSAWVHMDVTQMRKTHKGKHDAAFQVHIKIFFFYYLFGELFMSLKEYNNSLFSFNVPVYSRPCIVAPRWILHSHDNSKKPVNKSWTRQSFPLPFLHAFGGKRATCSSRAAFRACSQHNSS